MGVCFLNLSEIFSVLDTDSLELWDLARIILKLSKMSTFCKFQDKKVPNKASSPQFLVFL